MSHSNNSSYYSENITAATFADCLANSKNIFELIDAVFPIDSCRHYEVLPLSLEDSNLEIGMINPNNHESLKFVNSIARVFKYNLNLKLIDLQTLQIILDSYPQNLPDSKTAKGKDKSKTVVEATIIEENFKPEKFSSLNNNLRSKLADSAPTVISQPTPQSHPQSENNISNLEDLPADLDFLKDLDLSTTKTSQSSSIEKNESKTLYEVPPEFLNQHSYNSNNLDNKQTVISDNPAELIERHQSELELAQAQISELIAEVSNQIEEPEISANSDFFAELNFQLSWQKLLEQAFKYGTEEIELIRYSDRGSINAKKNKISQSSVKQVPLPIFCSLIDEIKRMAKISLELSNHPKKIVLERFYQEERILLRLEFTIKDKNETVIVQIFRGNNLKAYEQDQIDKMSERALYFAKELEKTLRKIQACFDSADFNNLRELQTVQSRINHQLRLLDK